MRLKLVAFYAIFNARLLDYPSLQLLTHYRIIDSDYSRCVITWKRHIFQSVAHIAGLFFRSNFYRCGWKPILCCSRGASEALWSGSGCMDSRGDTVYTSKWRTSILGWYAVKRVINVNLTDFPEYLFDFFFVLRNTTGDI